MNSKKSEVSFGSRHQFYFGQQLLIKRKRFFSEEKEVLVLDYNNIESFEYGYTIAKGGLVSIILRSIAWILLTAALTVINLFSDLPDFRKSVSVTYIVNDGNELAVSHFSTRLEEGDIKKMNELLSEKRANNV